MASDSSDEMLEPGGEPCSDPNALTAGQIYAQKQKQKQLEAQGDSSEESYEDEHDPEWINSEDRCQAVCAQLLQQELVAVDIEGVRLGRDGSICIIQVACADGSVFLFDVVVMGASIFGMGLKQLLESESVAKMFYDCRSDADALFHLYGIRMQHVLDMQVLCAKATSPRTHLQGMAKALGHVLPYAERQRIQGIKQAGLRMFAPEHGGKLEIWTLRPLPAILQTYCAADVIHLFSMFAKWEGCLEHSTLRAISETRMRARVDWTSTDPPLPNPALIDFVFPADSLEEDGPPLKRQRQDD
eukprot:TRINITY_DN14796_c0_g1_i1.p1 TRINITY_DN14796_c0_g1~~TRINITY_DN14796_c0_g1_i1.p1  ORF type:complete len:300 (+),score=58.29 TRINITY_DN14796_c0_g1_i1:13-912(+)